MTDQIQQLPELTVERALLSVSDKTGIVDLGKALHVKNIEILSTGGTAKMLRDAGIPVTSVSEITNFPECLDGRVKTLHPMIHGALLARPRQADHARTISELGIRPVQLVVVNLYPFRNAVTAKPGDLEHAVENIDIGGPAMIRAAAKNFENVCVLTDPGQYKTFLEAINGPGACIRPELRASLAKKAFLLTADYDRFIAEHLDREFPDKQPYGHPDDQSAKPMSPPDYLSVDEPLYQSLRYGENPHQPAAVYGDPGPYIDCFHGKELSYNNFLDIDAALQLGADFLDTCDALCAIFKHNLPCGVALSDNTVDAWEKAFSTDTVSPFGGIILFNRTLDIRTVEAVDRIFSEIILAPGFDDDARELLERKANRRLVLIKKWPEPHTPRIRSITGGYLWQHEDSGFERESHSVVTKVQPDDTQRKNLSFAWKVVKHVKSNAIVYAGNQQTLGIGTGQPSRVDASRFAAQKARFFGHSLEGSVIASDAFFPFADSVEEAALSGAVAVIQPGGSIRDDEVISEADKNGMSMILTGTRHFRH